MTSLYDIFKHSTTILLKKSNFVMVCLLVTYEMVVVEVRLKALFDVSKQVILR